MDIVYPTFGGMFHLLPTSSHCYLPILTIRLPPPMPRNEILMLITILELQALLLCFGECQSFKSGSILEGSVLHHPSLQKDLRL